MAKFGLLFNFYWFSGWKIFISMYHPPVSYNSKWAINKTKNKVKTWEVPSSWPCLWKYQIFLCLYGAPWLDGSRALQKWQIDRYVMHSFLTDWQNWDITLFSNSSLGLVIFLCLVATKSKSRLVCFLVLGCHLQECRFWPNLVLVSGVDGSFTRIKPEALWYNYDSFFLGVPFLCYANLTISEKKIYNVRFITFSQKFLCGKLLPFSLLIIICYLGRWHIFMSCHLLNHT